MTCLQRWSQPSSWSDERLGSEPTCSDELLGSNHGTLHPSWSAVLHSGPDAGHNNTHIIQQAGSAQNPTQKRIISCTAVFCYWVINHLKTKNNVALLELKTVRSGVGKRFGVEGRMSPQGTCCGLDRQILREKFNNCGLAHPPHHDVMSYLQKHWEVTWRFLVFCSGLF